MFLRTAKRNDKPGNTVSPPTLFLPPSARTNQSATTVKYNNQLVMDAWKPRFNIDTSGRTRKPTRISSRQVHKLAPGRYYTHQHETAVRTIRDAFLAYKEKCDGNYGIKRLLSSTRAQDTAQTNLPSIMAVERRRRLHLHTSYQILRATQNSALSTYVRKDFKQQTTHMMHMTARTLNYE